MGKKQVPSRGTIEDSPPVHRREARATRFFLCCRRPTRSEAERVETLPYRSYRCTHTEPLAGESISVVRLKPDLGWICPLPATEVGGLSSFVPRGGTENHSATHSPGSSTIKLLHANLGN